MHLVAVKSSKKLSETVPHLAEGLAGLWSVGEDVDEIGKDAEESFKGIHIERIYITGNLAVLRAEGDGLGCSLRSVLVLSPREILPLRLTFSSYQLHRL